MRVVLFFSLSNQTLDFLDRSGHWTQQLDACARHINVVFDANLKFCRLATKEYKLNGEFQIKHESQTATSRISTGTYASNAAVLLDLVLHQEFGQFFILKRLVQQGSDEIAARLDRKTHPFLHHTRRTQALQARLVASRRMPFQVAANIVRVDADEVAQTVRHEHGSQSASRTHRVSLSNLTKFSANRNHYKPVFDHLVQFAGQQASADESLQNHTLSQKMHINPADARLQRSAYRQIRIQNGIIDQRLLFAELAVARVRARDVARIAEVLASHVEQTQVVLFQLLVVRFTGVT